MEAVRTLRWKYIRYIDSDPLIEEFYDLSSDPQELQNLSDSVLHQEKKRVMRNQWQEWRERVQ
jgi:hypothetical protein